MSMSRIGIREVAQEAGVSLTTVSHVLNNKPDTRITAATARRVREAAEKLGYIPNRFARGLRNMPSDLIGLIAEEIAVTPYAGQIILGAQEEATKQRLTLAIVNAELSQSITLSDKPVKALVDRGAAGIIYATVYHDVVSVTDLMLERPTILIGATETEGRISSVTPDEKSAAHAVVEMLTRLGHSRIGYAASSEGVPATSQRIVGYQQAMQEAKLSTEGLIFSGSSDSRGGYETGTALIRQGVTAIFCYNDRMAMGVYRAASEAGLSIPDDLSVVGFDNQAPIPEGLFPSLTTVALPHLELGIKAVSMLASLIAAPHAGADSRVRNIQLPCPIVERESVSQPRDESA